MSRWPALATLIVVVAVSGCATQRAVTANDSTALIMVPADQAGIRDRRSEFRDVFCTVLSAHQGQDGSGENCDSWLVRLADEPRHSPVRPDLHASKRAITVLFVPGFASDCVDETKQTRTDFKDSLARAGYHFQRVQVSGISSSEENAKLIRDTILADPELGVSRQLIVAGHSKGVDDILEALVMYPELQPRVTAVVSFAGAVGGSPLADLAPDVAVSIARNIPGITCDRGDGLALESLSPLVRQRWLASHKLPDRIRYYSVVTLPTPDRVSSGLKPGYNVLSEIDPRNDGILLFYDQVIPGSTLLGYVNADHWAIARDFDSSEFALVRTLGDKTDFPRQALLEATLRFIELDPGAAPQN